jgi:hypothetical protein
MRVAAWALAMLLLLTLAAPPAFAQPAGGLSALLPAADRVPVANAEIVTGTQDLFTVAASFPEQAVAMRDLQKFGFEENVYRDYISWSWSDPYLPNRVEISLHRFRTATGATGAMTMYANSRATTLGLSGGKVRERRGAAMQLSGAVEGGNEVTIYVAERGILARVTVISPAGDPEIAARKLARSLRKAILLATPEPPAATGGTTSVAGVPAAPAPAGATMLDALRSAPFGATPPGDELCCVALAAETALGLEGEVGTVYFRAQPTGYVTTVVPTLRYTVFTTPEAARAAWDRWVADRAEFLPYRELESPSTGGPPAVLFTSERGGDTTSATAFLLADNVIVTAAARTSDWQALLPEIAERNAISLLTAGYNHLLELAFG